MKKICTKCKEEKSTTDFTVDNRHSTGLQAQCKQCHANRKREIRASKNKEDRDTERKYNRDRAASRTPDQKEKIKNQNREYRKTESARKRKKEICNGEEYKKWKRDYNARPEVIVKRRAAQRAWCQTEFGMASNRNSSSKRRFLKKETNDGTIPVNHYFPLTGNLLLKWKKQDGKCSKCKTQITLKTAELDHTIPLSRGGEHSTKNTTWMCRTCNASKGAKLTHEMSA